jgi:hypothetical protein
VFKSYQQFPSGRTLQNISNPYGQWLDTKTMIYEGKFGENATPVYISTSVSSVIEFLKQWVKIR